MSGTPSASSPSSVQRPNGTPTTYLSKAELRRIGRASLQSRARQHAAELQEVDTMDLDSDDEIDMVGGRPPRQHATPSPDTSDAASERSDRDRHTAFVPRAPQSHFSEAPMHALPPGAPLTAATATAAAADAAATTSSATTSAPTLSGAAQPARRPKSRFTFGLGAMFKFNPLHLVDEVKSAWVRQKEAYEARKRDELIREARELERKEYERQYFALKAQGAFKPSFPKPEDFADDAAEPRLPAWKLDGLGTGSSRKRKHQELRRTSREAYIDDDQEPDAHEPDTEGDEPTPAKIPKRSTSANLLRRTKEVFTSGASSSTTTAAAKPPKPLTKREKAKQEKLAKKVSTLEEQLQKAKRELEATAPPPPTLPASAASADTVTLMPPPPVPNGKKHGDAESGDEDEDTTMDEGFSMIPLSPVVQSANSSFADGGKTSGRARKPTAKALEMESARKKGRARVKAEDVEL